MAAAIAAPELETHAALLQGQATAEATSKSLAKWLKDHPNVPNARRREPALTAAQVRKSVTATIVPKTQLVQVRARARSPENAELIATKTAESYTAMNQGLARPPRITRAAT